MAIMATSMPIYLIPNSSQTYPSRRMGKTRISHVIQNIRINLFMIHVKVSMKAPKSQAEIKREAILAVWIILQK